MPEEVKSLSLSHHDRIADVDDSSSDHDVRYLHERESSSRSESSSCSDESTVCYKQQNGSHDTSVEVIPTRTLKTSVPKPAANPLQFVKIGPCDLYRSAQQQLKKEKPKKEVKEEDIEDWQSNLDNWKCSRRKQQEHIIERVVEVKKLELEEHDRNRKRTKTFSEMMEERTSKGGRKPSLVVYTDEDNEDLSDLGLSLNKSKSPSIPEENENGEYNDRNGGGDDGDCNVFENDNGTVTDGDVVDAAITYESAIQNYETRMQALTNRSCAVVAKKPVAAKMISSPSTANGSGTAAAAEAAAKTSTSPIIRKFGGRRSSAAKIEEKLCELERIKNRSISSTDLTETNKSRVQIPKVNVFQRKEIFEKGNAGSNNDGGGVDYAKTSRSNDELQPPSRVRTVKERLSSLKDQLTENEQQPRPSLLSLPSKIKAADDVSAKDRRTLMKEKNKESTCPPPPPPMPTPTPPPSAKMTCEEETGGKEFLSGRSSSSSEEFEHGGHMHHYHQHHRSLDSLQGHDSPNGFCFERVQSLESIDCCGNYPASVLSGDTDREDSGIHTADVSSSVSQADDYDLHADSSSMDTAVVETKTSIAEVESSHDELVAETVVESADRNDGLPPESAAQRAREDARVESAGDVTLTPKKHDQEEEDKEEEAEEEKDTAEMQNETVVETTLQQCVSSQASSGDRATAEYEDVPEGLSPTESVFAFEPSTVAVEPPKEKPPPPPALEQSDDESDDTAAPLDADDGVNLRRMDSTKRIKKEIRQKRSSFLGIEGGFDDDSYLEPELESVKRPPDMTSFLQEERRLEKLLYRQSICSESDSTLGESRDSGVELDGGGGNRHIDDNHWSAGGNGDGDTNGHSRPGSDEMYANMSTTMLDEDEITRKEREILEILELEERQRGGYEMELPPSKGETSVGGDLGTRLVLKLKELERQKSSRWNADNDEYDGKESPRTAAESHYDRVPERKQPESALLEQKWAVRSLQDVSRDCSTNLARHSADEHRHQEMPNSTNDYRSSMPNIQQESATTKSQTVLSQYRVPPPIPPNKPAHLRQSVLANKVSAPQQMSKQTLQALSAVPRSKIMDSWVLTKKKQRPETYNYQHWLIQEAEHRRITEYQQRCSGNNDTQRVNSNYANVNVVGQHGGDYLESTATRLSEVPMNGGGEGGRVSSAATAQQLTNHRSSSHPPTTHMLPHRNRSQGFVLEKNSNSKSSPPMLRPQQQQYSKPLPDSVIQTLTQRVQNRLGSVHDTNKSRRRENFSSGTNQQEKMLSVSGKKKCSHCGEELGRGAAMIIESLRLFYHIDCFKCCVCCVQLGDGLMGTDVRVRNSKLHCHSCYSNDEGVKFSCV